MPDLLALHPTMAPCPTCGQMTLLRVFHHGSKIAPPRWEVLSPPQTPLTGQAHVCKKENV